MKTLQGKLQLQQQTLEDFELPSQSKASSFGKTSEKNDVEKSKVLIENFLNSILCSDALHGSELLYMFFTDNWENDDLQTEDVKKHSDTKFTKIKQMFTHSECKKSKESLEDLMLLDEFHEKVADDLAEPLYALISEIYELKGVFRWFRRSLISIAYISFGGTISRKLLDTVNWLVGETMMVSYLSAIKEIIAASADLQTASPVTDEVPWPENMEFPENYPYIFNFLME